MNLSNDLGYIELLKQGDSKAFSLLVDNFQHPIYNTVLNITQCTAEAEDITQEVFLLIYKNIHQFRGESKLSTWIYKIAISKSLEWERRKKSKRVIGYFKNLIGLTSLENEIVDFIHPGVSLENKENAHMLFKAMQLLPNNQRIAFILINIEGLTYQEVSDIMKKSIKSIEGLVQRAKENLRKKLTKDYSS